MRGNPPADGEFDTVEYQVLQSKWECNQALREVPEQVVGRRVAGVRQVVQGVVRRLGSVLDRVFRRVRQGRREGRRVVVLLLGLRWE